MRLMPLTDIKVGQPLPRSVYDKSGCLLLRKGVMVSLQQQVERLLAYGLFVDEETDVPSRPIAPVKAVLPPVFDEIGALTLRLKTAFTAFFGTSPATDAGERVVALVREIHAATVRDADAAIAAVHLDFHNPYLLSHHVHSAVLCSLLGRRLGMADDELVAVMCAALTYDIGLVNMLYLEKQIEPLSAEQTDAIRRHPLKGVEILKRAGVDDEAWISAITNHHERVDGSGYPNGLSGVGLSVGARMVGMVDSYTAMIKGKLFRHAKVPGMVIGEIFHGKHTQFGADVCEALAKELGMYPPGAVVRLANGEIAVVKERSAKTKELQVFSVYDSSGMPFISPRQRDVKLDEYVVKAPVAYSECRSVATIIRRLWTK